MLTWVIIVLSLISLGLVYEFLARKQRRWILDAAKKGFAPAAGGGSKKTSSNNRNSWLLVIAHPDDECLFFGPTLINLVDCGAEVNLVCLSSGDFYGRGYERGQELLEAAKLFKLNSVKLIQDSRLQDGANHHWPPQLIADIINQEIDKQKVNHVITFDSHGVSGHPNHGAIQSGVLELLNSLSYPSSPSSSKKISKFNNIRFYSLDSIFIVRKYLLFIDATLVLFLHFVLRLFIDQDETGSSLLFALPFKEYSHLRRCLHSHNSQMVWYRHLYSFTSRYMLINHLKSLN